MSIVRIQRDDDYEMVRIYVDDVLKFEGNYWDLSDDTWVGILKYCNIKVVETNYNYE